MRKHDPILIGGLVALLFVIWLGFPLHASPRFAGSFWGGVLAIIGTTLMLVPLLYSIIKRIKRVKKVVTRYASMKNMLTWHIYAGVFGPILVLLHTGHKYESPLGIALAAMTLIVVLSGFIGRFLNARITRTIKAKQAMLKELNTAYQEAGDDLHRHPDAASSLKPFTWIFTRFILRFLMKPEPAQQDLSSKVAHTIELAESIADLEYAIHTHEIFKRVFKIWLRTHIILSTVLYVLLAFHVWSAIHFGLRWFA